MANISVIPLDDTATAFYMQERLKSIMQQVQQLLPLLTLCANSTERVELIMHQISGQLADSACSTAAVQAHMQQLCHGLQVMSATAATSEDVGEAVSKIIQSSTKLSDGNMAEVQRLCNELHVAIALDLKDISGALHDMETSIRKTSIRMLGLQEQACVDLQWIKRFLTHKCGVAPDALDTSRVLMV
jgi:methyl-accepting chemotaxis protein